MASKTSQDNSDVSSRKSITENSGDSSESCFIHQSYNMNEELVGNVSKFIAYPRNYTGKLEAGFLMFHACFQSGNLGKVECISEFEYDLFVRPDTCNNRYRVWFNFTVQNVVCGQKVLFNIVNFSKTKSLYREGMSPVVKSTSRPKWHRIPSKNVFYYKSPDHHRNYVMSFAFAFDKDTDVYQFCYNYPYTYNKLQIYLNEMELLNLNYFKRERLCLSVQQRRVDLLTITSPHNLKEERKKRVVFFTARVHPGESPSSFVCQGIIDFLLSDHGAAQVLRDYIVFMIVPMLNPDGVVLGNYRCSLMGFDLNRYWHEPSPWAHPSILATKQLLLQLNSDPNVSLDFYMDLHAHSTAMNCFMYGNIYEEEDRLEQQAVFPRLLNNNAEDFSYNSTSFNNDAIKAGTGRRALGSCLSDQCFCYTLEVSFYAFLNGSMPVPYTEESYLKLGKNVVKTFVDYFKLSNILAQKLRKNMLNYEKNKRRSLEERASRHKDVMLKSPSDSVDKVRRHSWNVPKKNVNINNEIKVEKNNYVHLKFKHRSSKS